MHELHIWDLDQRKFIATAHVLVSSSRLSDFERAARQILECLHSYGIHSVTLQPEQMPRDDAHDSAGARTESQAMAVRHDDSTLKCRLLCGSVCMEKKCCGPAALQ